MPLPPELRKGIDSSLADFVNAETAKWAGVIKSSNIKLD